MSGARVLGKCAYEPACVGVCACGEGLEEIGEIGEIGGVFARALVPVTSRIIGNRAPCYTPPSVLLAGAAGEEAGWLCWPALLALSEI